MPMTRTAVMALAATAEEVVAVAADPGYLPNCPATDPKR